MKKYLVQAILIDGCIETVIDSFKTDDAEEMERLEATNDKREESC